MPTYARDRKKKEARGQYQKNWEEEKEEKPQKTLKDFGVTDDA